MARGFPSGVSGVRMEFFPSRVASLLASNRGPVSFANRRAAEAVKRKAIPLIGKKYSKFKRERKVGNHRELAKSGRVEPTPGAAWRVSFVSDHALAHHQGIPHRIRKAKGFMMFQAQEGGRVFAKEVSGNPGNPYLTNAAKKLGIKVSKTGNLKSNTVMLGELGKPVFRKFL